MIRADAADAARLVRYGLVPTYRPTPTSEYRSLLDRFRTDTEFAEDVRSVAEGFGLYVRAATMLGLVVVGDPDGPFKVTLDNCGLPLRSGSNRLTDRRCFGLVLTALSAFAYPDGDALAETSNPTVRPADLERFITRQAAAIAGAVTEDRADELDNLDVQLGEAALRWLDLPEVLPGDRGLRRDCRRAYVVSLLNFLVDAGRARREAALADDGGDAYTLNDRFRAGLLEVVETVAFEIYAAGRAGDAVEETV